jgi:hypothetical protein
MLIRRHFFCKLNKIKHLIFLQTIDFGKSVYESGSMRASSAHNNSLKSVHGKDKAAEPVHAHGLASVSLNGRKGLIVCALLLVGNPVCSAKIKFQANLKNYVEKILCLALFWAQYGSVLGSPACSGATIIWC